MENNNNLQDIRIAGAGNISAGEYNNVKISGAGEVLGTIKAQDVGVSGTGEFRGDINSKWVRASGTLECAGNIIVEEVFKVSGTGEVKENLKGKEIIVNGTCEVGGNVAFERMVSRGACEIKGDCEGEEFSSLGYIKIDGLLAADKINIVPEGVSYIKEIGGEEITIKAEKKKKIMFFKISISSDGVLNCDTIEGDKIYLENTQCKIIRGGDITVGKGCKIDKVEYTEEINITDKKSTIGEKVCMKI